MDGVPSQVEAMLRVWDERGGSRDELGRDAFAALMKSEDLTVLRVPEFVPRDSQHSCSVAGGYRYDPPTLIVTQSMSWRRQHFTVLHELGHHIQQTDLALGETVVEHGDPETFEDACCDSFAAQVLLPDDLVDRYTGDHGPTVSAATGLFEASNASRAAICVRLAGRLRSSGAVAVLDPAGIVTFAAARGEIFPPARGSDQSANPLVEVAMRADRDGRSVTREDALIWYRTGHTSDRLYGQAAWAGDRLFLIMVAYGAPWLSFSPPRDGTAERVTDAWIQCDYCQTEFAVKTKCNTCNQPLCPSDHCRCSAKTARTCPECFLQKHPSQFGSGSLVCSECAS
ncbi:ImmA/IrrE family metallo-endopeptidase [Nocardia salmonicida]|uniref:ImmA/IrrE family metallo-endopeptidase n=1 Tax=Nocardia salmonicida TaxID=53431 RepID=UPI0007A4E58A|nr:ImmA/IrrE family metallo-endopeptidase [Nocardia salmonicida]